MTRFLRRDIKYKIISLVLAMIIWFYVRGEIGQTNFFYHKLRGQNQVTFMNLPIRVLEISSEGMRSIVVEPDTVSLDVSVPNALMKTLKPQDIMVYVKVDGLLEGTYETLVSVEAPTGVMVLSDIQPVQISIKTPSPDVSLPGLNYSNELLRPLTEDKR